MAKEVIDYIICSPPYQHNSAGIRALYRLGADLRKQGAKTLVYNSIKTLNEGLLELASKATVIYPADIAGNPLGGKKSVKLIFAASREEKLEKIGKDDLVYYHSDFCRRNITVPVKGKLFIPTIEPEWFKDEGLERKGTVYYLGKTTNLEPIIGENWKQITRSDPAIRWQLAHLFKTSEVFYCFDNCSIIAHEAALCGCPAIIVPDGAYDEQDHLDYEMGMPGIAYGEANLQRAIDTISGAGEAYIRAIAQYPQQLQRFIRATHP